MDAAGIESFTKLLQFSVSPVVLISGVGLLLLSITNRLGRTVDRARFLAKEADSPAQAVKEHAREQIAILIRRCELLRASVTGGTLSIFFAGCMIMTLFLFLFLRWSTVSLVLLCFFLSVLSLVICVFFFLLDIFMSLKAVKVEVDRHLN